MLTASVLGAIGTLNRKPGGDLVVDLIVAAEAGVFWWACTSGRRSLRFLRTLEAAGLLFYFAGSSFIGRYVLVGFIEERSLLTAEGLLMADARIVLACLAKRPEDRLQSAAELRRMLDACPSVDDWDAERAQQWWQEHRVALHGDAPHSLGSHRTIAIDAHSRSALLEAG